MSNKITDRIQQVFEQFMKERFSHVKEGEFYYEEWKNRFEFGMEWQKSDYNSRSVLKFIAPDIYPDDRNAYFIRE